MRPEPNGERIPTQGRLWEARGEQLAGSGRTIRPQDCGKRAPKPTIYLAYRAQEVYPLSPLLRGGFQRRGGVPYQHESKFLTVFTNEPSGVSEGNCTTRILLVWGASASGVSKINKMTIERRRRGGSGRPGGEQSVGSGRTIRPQDCGKR